MKWPVVKEICHRVAVMEHGRVVEQGDVFNVFADPKQEITKNFIHTTSNLQKIEELVAENSPVVQLQPGEVIVRLSYLQRNVSEPLISTVSRKFNISLNIIFADITIVQDSPHRRNGGHHQRRAAENYGSSGIPDREKCRRGGDQRCKSFSMS